MQDAERQKKLKVVEREIVINNVKIHINSVFIGQTTLENALTNIIIRKISKSKTELSA